MVATYWPKLTVAPDLLPLADRKALLNLELLSRVTVNAAPPAGGYTLAVDSRIVGLEHNGSRDSWRMHAYTVPIF